jgi:uncharacterized protein (TIGR00369 family)
MIYKITGKQPNTRMCFVCGLKNEFGLKVPFYETESNEIISLFKPSDEHQGYPGRLHGGIASAILDETIGRAINIGKENEIWAVTVEINIKYKKPVPVNEEIKVIGRVINENKRLFHGTGEIILANGETAVTAEGKYLILPIDKIADFDRDYNDWRVVKSASDPYTIEI